MVAAIWSRIVQKVISKCLYIFVSQNIFKICYSFFALLRVFNIREIHEQQLQIAFNTTSDHSKWAVSQETGLKLWRWRIGGADWICVGDINRQREQLVRGGGSVCLKNSKVAQLYRQLIQGFEPCPRNVNQKRTKENEN